MIGGSWKFFLSGGIIARVWPSATNSRLCDWLQIDVSGSLSTLGWSPPVSLEEGLTRTVAGFQCEARV